MGLGNVLICQFVSDGVAQCFRQHPVSVADGAGANPALALGVATGAQGSVPVLDIEGPQLLNDLCADVRRDLIRQ